MRQQLTLFLMAAWSAMYVAAAAIAATPTPGMSGMQKPGMNMAAHGQPAGPTREAYTGNHTFLIKLRSIPHPIPFEQYFTLQLIVYDGHDPAKALPGAHLTVFAGMRHGLKTGFAHRMQSTPRVRQSGGLFTVSGMYFHMEGPWILVVHVERDGQRGTAYFKLPCCGR